MSLNKGMQVGMHRSVVKVAESLLGDGEVSNAFNYDVREAADSLSKLLDNEGTKHAAFALACSVLNNCYAKTGWILRQDRHAGFVVEYHQVGPIRDTMLGILDL